MLSRTAENSLLNAPQTQSYVYVLVETLELLLSI